MDFVTASVICQYILNYLVDDRILSPPTTIDEIIEYRAAPYKRSRYPSNIPYIYWRLRTLSKLFKQQVDLALPRWKAKRRFVVNMTTSHSIYNILPNGNPNGICMKYDIELFLLDGEILTSYRVLEDKSITQVCYQVKYPYTEIRSPTEVSIYYHEHVLIHELYISESAIVVNNAIKYLPYRINFWNKFKFHFVIRSATSLIYHIQHDAELVKMFLDMSTNSQTVSAVEGAAAIIANKFALERDAPYQIVYNGLFV